MAFVNFGAETSASTLCGKQNSIFRNFLKSELYPDFFFLKTFLLGILILFDFTARIPKSFGEMVFISECRQFKGFLETFLENFLPVDTVFNLVGNVKRAHLKLKEARKKRETLIELTLELTCKKATWLYISFEQFDSISILGLI